MDGARRAPLHLRWRKGGAGRTGREHMRLLGSQDGSTTAMRWFGCALLLALIGYQFGNRGFAYAHIPGTPLFVGELVLLLGAVQATRVARGLPKLVRRSFPLRALIPFMALGLFLTAADFPAWRLDAARDAALWYYASVAFLVSFALHCRSLDIHELAGAYRRVIPVFVLWAPIVVIANRLTDLPAIPGTATSIISYKSGDAAVHLAMALAFLWLYQGPGWMPARSVRQALTVFGIGGILVAGSVNRGGLVAACLILGLTALIAPQRRNAIAVCLTGAALMVSFLAFSGLELQLGPRTLSVEQLQKNIDTVLTVGSREDDGTTQWRLELWEEVATDVLSGEHGLFGLGFGINVAHLYDAHGPEYWLQAQPLRNPHNSHISVLARMGVPGASLWIAFWVVWFTAMVRAVRQESLVTPRGQLAAWVAISVSGILLNSVFDPTLEGPQVAVWLWTLVGVGSWIAVPNSAHRDRCGHQSDSATGRASSR